MSHTNISCMTRAGVGLHQSIMCGNSILLQVQGFVWRGWAYCSGLFSSLTLVLSFPSVTLSSSGLLFSVLSSVSSCRFCSLNEVQQGTKKTKSPGQTAHCVRVNSGREQQPAKPTAAESMRGCGESTPTLPAGGATLQYVQIKVDPDIL